MHGMICIRQNDVITFLSCSRHIRGRRPTAFILENVIGSPAEVVEYTRFDEALVIGAALSLSSSAFVLKIMQERGQLATKSGSAALGILLLQDIAVVPLLVLLPIIENSQGAMPMSEQAALLGVTFLKAILGLGGILVVGGQVTKFLFTWHFLFCAQFSI